MNTTVLNIKVDRTIKQQAQEVARQMGITLSALVNGYLRDLIKTKTAIFSAKEEPTQYLIDALKESHEDTINGRVSPVFTNADEAIMWLNDANRKYEYQSTAKQKIHKKVRQA